MTINNGDHVELKGSCLCGAQSYIASGKLFGFYHCHCSRCQKMTGTGHASNILLTPSELKLKGDHSKIGIYRLPDADRFASRFCKECGGQLPKHIKETSFTVVPAGSLDENVDIEPQCRIFWDSRSEWSCSDKELPTFSKYPIKD